MPCPEQLSGRKIATAVLIRRLQIGQSCDARCVFDRKSEGFSSGLAINLRNSKALGLRGAHIQLTSGIAGTTRPRPAITQER